MHSLGSAAAQGGQDTSTEHANGSHFTGWDTGVQRFNEMQVPLPISRTSTFQQQHAAVTIYLPH